VLRRAEQPLTARARAQVSAVGILLSLACGEWIALVAFVVALGGAATQQVLPFPAPPPPPVHPHLTDRWGGGQSMVCVAALVLQVGAALYALMDITACQSPLPTPS